MGGVVEPGFLVVAATVGAATAGGSSAAAETSIRIIAWFVCGLACPIGRVLGVGFAVAALGLACFGVWVGVWVECVGLGIALRI